MNIDSSNNYNALQAAADDLSKAHIIIQTNRPGSRLFSVKLEFEHYPPRSGKNKDFDLHIVHWPVENGTPLLIWFVIGIPVNDLEMAKEVAKECGLEIIDGIPVMFSPTGGEEYFPMKGPNVYGVQSNPLSNVYKNNPALYKKMIEGEVAECDRILKADEDKIRVELKAEGHTPEQIEAILQSYLDGVQLVEPKPTVNDGQHRRKG